MTGGARLGRNFERLTTCPNCKVEFVPKKTQWPPDHPAKPRYCSNSCSKQRYFVKLCEGKQASAFMCVAAE